MCARFMRGSHSKQQSEGKTFNNLITTTAVNKDSWGRLEVEENIGRAVDRWTGGPTNVLAHSHCPTMSAYASSIPGAHLIPYFAFGPLVADEEDENDDDAPGELEKTPDEASKLGVVGARGITGSPAGTASGNDTVGEPALKDLTLDDRVTPVGSSSSLSSSFYCKINSARVDSVELLKSLSRR